MSIKKLTSSSTEFLIQAITLNKGCVIIQAMNFTEPAVL